VLLPGFWPLESLSLATVLLAQAATRIAAVRVRIERVRFSNVMGGLLWPDFLTRTKPVKVYPRPAVATIISELPFKLS
jgi:hypothetical protein